MDLKSTIDGRTPPATDGRRGGSLISGPVHIEDPELELCHALTTAAEGAVERLAMNVIEIVPVRLRSHAEDVERRLRGARLHDPRLRQDVAALADRLRPFIEAGRYVGWHGDEHHVRGGYEVVKMDPETRALQRGLEGLDAFVTAADDLSRWLRAIRVRDQLPPPYR